MRLIISLTTAAAFCAFSSSAWAQAAPSAPAAAPAATPAAAPAGPAAKAAAFQLKETSWSFVEKGTDSRMSIDAKGNYIENSAAGKHIDHGTAVVKGDKACFTSAMTKDGEVCWTTKPVEVGQSMDTVSDKGEKLTVNRVAYTPLSMPK
jgi:hypothetical protein